MGRCAGTASVLPVVAGGTGILASAEGSWMSRLTPGTNASALSGLSETGCGEGETSLAGADAG